MFDFDKTGSEKIEANSSAKSKQRLMDMYAEHYRGDFQENHEKKVPRHPWHIFKRDRREVRETFEGDEKCERVYVLQQLFEEYKRKWEEYRADFKRDDN